MNSWCAGSSSEAQPASVAYAAIPFVYDTSEAKEAQALAPSESPAVAVDAVPDMAFVPKFAVPSSVQAHLPKSERMHKVHCPSLDKLCLMLLPVWQDTHTTVGLQIILQTAKFVRQAGGQTEFVLRVKQAANPNFKFLEPNDQQHAYFRWLVATKPEVSCL